MTATDTPTSPNSAPQPQPDTKSHRATGKPCGRPRKYPEGVKAHLKAVKAEKRAQQAATLATLQASTPVVPTVRPLPPSLINVAPYPTSEEVEKMVREGGFDLTELGQSCACATGLLSAILELLTHKAAFAATGLRWSILHLFCAWSSDFERLYRAALLKLDEKRVQVLREAAFERAVVGAERGVWFNGVKVGVENIQSDKMAELMLRGLDPSTFGKVDGEGNQQAVQVNITL